MAKFGKRMVAYFSLGVLVFLTLVIIFINIYTDAEFWPVKEEERGEVSFSFNETDNGSDELTQRGGAHDPCTNPYMKGVVEDVMCK